jgi:hypothetical protein
MKEVEGQVAHIVRKRNAYKGFVKRSKGEQPLGKLGRRRKDNI